MRRIVLSGAARHDRRVITRPTVRHFGISQARRLRATVAGDALLRAAILPGTPPSDFREPTRSATDLGSLIRKDMFQIIQVHDVPVLDLLA